MKTNLLNRFARTADDAFVFAVPALLLAAAMLIVVLTVMLGALPTESTADTVTSTPEAVTPIGA